MSVKITFIGHSAFKISTENHAVLIDPFITGNPLAAYSDLKADDILVTHAHGDHLGDSIEISKKTGSQITAVFELANYCAEKGAISQPVNIGGKVNFSWGSAYWLPAVHSSGTPDGKYGGEAASILVNIGGKTIYHAGDTGLHYDMKMVGEFYKPEVSLLPIGGHFTMGIDEAVHAAEWLGSQKVIPMHYNTFPPIKADPEEFKSKIETLGKECIVLKPGEGLVI
jgi:L-ascorbate metabolism protein UlaG (beta-lactamase superfamily)